MQLGSHVSVSKARRILGAYGRQFSDDQVRELLHTLHQLAREQLWYNGSKEGMSSHESSTVDEP